MIILYFIPIIIVDLIIGFSGWRNRPKDFESWIEFHFILLLSFAIGCAIIGVTKLPL